MNKGEFIYRASYVLFVVILKSFYGLKIEGKENIPQKGPAILVANHFSLLDPFIVTCCTKRIIHWFVAGWVFRIKPFAFFAKQIPFLKVEPGKGNNKDALKQAVNLLSQGRLIGIFPEGKLSRNGELNPFLLGASYLGIKTRVPVVPLYINGAHQAFKRGRKFFNFPKISVIIGKGFSLDGIHESLDKNDIQECSSIIRSRIEELKKEG